METTAKQFHEMFKKIDFSGHVAKSLEKTHISDIRVNKALGKLTVEISHDNIIDESCLDAFKAQLKDQFPSIKDVDIHMRYALDNKDPHALINAYWNNILHIVNCKSPLCHKILSQSSWVVKDNNLSITVKNKAAFLFSKRGIDKLIANMLENQLMLSLTVTIADEATSTDAESKRELTIIQRQSELLEQAMNEMPPVFPSEGSSKPPKGNKFDPSNKKRQGGRKKTRFNSELSGEHKLLSKDLNQDEEIFVDGKIIGNPERRDLKSENYLVIFDVTDGKNSVTVKFFCQKDDYAPFENLFKTSTNVAVKGKVAFDEYSKELNIMAHEIGPGTTPVCREDASLEKRVELHLHTQMSAMDGISPVKSYIDRAISWGHKAIAITDHGVVQAFPDAMNAAKGKDIKIIYGVEAYLVDDLGVVVQCPANQTLYDTYTVFDLETTGLSKENNKITEIGAVKVENGQITHKYSSFVNPGVQIPAEITKLTGIDNKMVKDAPNITAVLPDFLAFAGDSVLVAHNASFDVGFITTAAKNMNIEIKNTVLDTLELSKTLFPELPKHKLDAVAQHLDVSLENHHRAADDAQATAEIFCKYISILEEKSVKTLEDVNLLASDTINKSKLKYYHAIILAKNYTGLKNLYELISKSHIDYFFRRPRIPKSEYLKLKDGLIIGTACEAGEFYKAVLDNKPDEYIRQLANFYDYFEIQPIDNNLYLVMNGRVPNRKALRDINEKIVSLGEVYNKPVVATCDVHFMEPEDEVYRRIIMAGGGFKDADNQAPLYFRTTNEMLEEFSYLGEQKAREVVIKNPNLIAGAIEDLKPIPDDTFTPFIEGAEESLRDITMAKAKEVYGEPLPELVEKRLDRELGSIIKNGFAVMYIIAQKLVWKSVENGYRVGSRGSVGSSFVATMASISEVNPLPPHYICPNCKYTDFESELVKSFAGASGCDMPEMACPHCETPLNKDGHDIPFETFLGFDGDKEPDIDLNFSGEYQLRAHAHAEELFGEGNVFKAGTIGTLADKTAKGYVRKYMEEKGVSVRNAEINRLMDGCVGIKKTTGQHPGGIMILPEGHSIYEFSPIQRPANDMKSNVTTTHFDYHAISGRLLKLDLLGHDAPTIMKMLYDFTGLDPEIVNLGDKAVISLFTSPEALGITSEDIGCKTGTLGLPEFGTYFVRSMLLETNPSTFADLVRISGLSHGTNVWTNNAQELIKDKVTTFKEIITTRDEIMAYLINMGVERKSSFKIMESVRKGYGLLPEQEEILVEAGVPSWYIESCKKIKYMFPKGHAVAYVMMTVRIGYYKIHHPYSFYASTLTVKADDFDYELMCHGIGPVKAEMSRIYALGRDATAKDGSTITILELVLEMYARGLKFAPFDLYSADATSFKILEDGLLPPLCSIQGLGISVAKNIVSARENGEFSTIDDFRDRTKTNKTVIELLKKNKILDGLPETNQLSLF